MPSTINDILAGRSAIRQSVKLQTTSGIERHPYPGLRKIDVSGRRFCKSRNVVATPAGGAHGGDVLNGWPKIPETPTPVTAWTFQFAFRQGSL